MGGQSEPTYGPQLGELLSFIEQTVVERLQHGHFTLGIRCELGKEAKRHVVVEDGKQHKFVIPIDELPSKMRR